MSNLSSLGKEGYLPQEEMLEVGRKQSWFVYWFTQRKGFSRK